MTTETEQQETEDKGPVDYETLGELGLTEDEARYIESEGAEPDEEEEQPEDEGAEEEAESEEAEDTEDAEGDDDSEEEDEAEDPPKEDEPPKEEREEPFIPKYSKEGDDKRDFESEKAELAKLYEDGEIDVPAYVQKVQEIAKAEAAIEADKNLAQQLDQREQARLEKQWNMAVNEFAEDASNEPILKSETLRRILNENVQSLAKQPDAAERGYKWMLNEAKRDMIETLGLSIGPKPKAEDPTPTKPKPERKPDVTRIPKPLSNVPAAAEHEDGQDRYAGLDDAPVGELEHELARMSEREQEKFLSTSPGSKLTKEQMLG